METSVEKTPLLPEKSRSDVESNYGESESQRLHTSSSTSLQQLLQSRLLLLGVALVYGSLNVTLRMVYERPGPPSASVLSTTRGWMAVICFLPLLRFSKSDRARPSDDENDLIEGMSCTASASPDSSPSLSSDHSQHQRNNTAASALIVTDANRHFLFWRFALELAVFNFGTQGLLNLGLITTASARASFLVQLSVVITPTISAALGHALHGRVWCACVIALAGLYLLSSSSPSRGDSNLLSVQFTTGDLCCLGAAVCWSYYIYRMSAWGEYVDETMTQFCKNILLASMYAAWMIISLMVHNDERLWEGWKDPISWVLLFYSALAPCTIADIVQQKAQSFVPAAESNVILSLEPVFTAILGTMLLGEMLSRKEIMGGCLIVVASVLASY
ncbi:EamA-like transporter family protein [Nitzschia inconspicua]|uniref:EamA-like transporter family protein n=1 Tax=Nitzschia inconspicua TaxID=303405 RepID=A0A9K3PR03_9STRA|nr:EamA-like transporter family protein [Nitzschia inconspicua]